MKVKFKGRDVHVVIQHGQTGNGYSSRYTSVTLKDPRFKDAIAEVSLCHPKDQFCRKTGIKLALTKIFNKLDFKKIPEDKKEYRRKIWRTVLGLDPKVREKPAEFVKDEVVMNFEERISKVSLWVFIIFCLGTLLLISRGVYVWMG